MHLFGRKKDLLLIGPPGLAEILSLQLRYSETTLHFKIDFREFRPGESQVIYDHSGYDVTTIPMDHRVPCSGFLFKEKPKKRRINPKVFSDFELSRLEMIALKNGQDLRNEDGSIKYENKILTLDPHPSHSYAYCSDSRYKPALTPILEGVDLMYHEATFAEDMKDRAESTYHSTASQAAQLAKDARVKKLILGHFSARYRELDPIFNEARLIFENTELAIEGTKFQIND